MNNVHFYTHFYFYPNKENWGKTSFWNALLFVNPLSLNSHCLLYLLCSLFIVYFFAKAKKSFFSFVFLSSLICWIIFKSFEHLSKKSLKIWFFLLCFQVRKRLEYLMHFKIHPILPSVRPSFVSIDAALEYMLMGGLTNACYFLKGINHKWQRILLVSRLRSHHTHWLPT